MNGLLQADAVSGSPPSLDHQATTPSDPAVVAALEPYWRQDFANASSRLHRPGLLAAAALEQARRRLAATLGARAEQVLFTSGATEANNLALKGLAEAERTRGGNRRHLITVATEHRAVLEPITALARQGHEVTMLPVEANGLLDLGRLQAALRPDTLAVSVMAANNEIGVLQPLTAIARLCRERGVRLHCDGAQAVGHLRLRVQELGLDLLSLSGHKFHGPKGIGALVVADGVVLAPQMHGGDQERGLRAGTLPLPLIMGLAEAASLAEADREERQQRLGALRDRLWTALESLGDVTCNGDLRHRLAHNLNVSIGGVDGTRLHQELRRHLAVSSGSACSQGRPSHVLTALGRTRQQATASIRFSFGRPTTDADIDRAIEVVARTVQDLRGAAGGRRNDGAING
ncbi:MAG: cysteine desulfurase family protein [Cyanobacteriota bacterium]